MPGFAEAFEAGTLAGVAGVEAEALAGGEVLDEEHVPDIEWGDVDGEGIDVFGGVNPLAFAVDVVHGLNVIAAGAENFGAFELYAPEAGAGIENEIVALAIPRLGDAEIEAGGFVKKGGFGELSDARWVAAASGGASGFFVGRGEDSSYGFRVLFRVWFRVLFRVLFHSWSQLPFIFRLLSL